MVEWTVGREGELRAVAAKILSLLTQRDFANVLALRGELGAGKTALVKALATELGIKEHVTSPTFVLMKSYDVPLQSHIQKLIHIDAYRIEDIKEASVLNLEALFKMPGALVCIEWPERIASLVPKSAERISIEIKGDKRHITYDG